MSINELIKETKTRILWNIFITILLEVICLTLYLIFSALAGTFIWTIEDLTSSPLGFGVQLVNLASLIVGAAIAVFILAYISIVLKEIFKKK
jgi:hypothetical protein